MFLLTMGMFIIYSGKDSGSENYYDVSNPDDSLQDRSGVDEKNNVVSQNEAPGQSERNEQDLSGKKTESGFVFPVSDALLRATKKPFGVKVSPSDSPVSPEKFSGYHTGVDFEIFSGEEDAEIPISAICSGPLLEKRIVAGYGGVAIQKCSIFDLEVTVFYGHLKFSSIEISQTTEISAGEKIGILGKGYSAETSGERKHLHLGIHKGNAIMLLGYVQKKEDLGSWLDILDFLK